MDALIEPGFERVDCPGCGFNESAAAYDGRDWVLDSQRVLHIVRCGRCGLCYTNPRPDAGRLGDYYKADYAPYQRQKGELERDSRGSTLLRTWVLADAYGSPACRPGGWRRGVARFVQLFRSRDFFGFGVAYHGEGRLLDFGCGNGTFLRRMKAIGWTCLGLDFSAEAVAAVRAGGIEAMQGSLPHPELSGERFDVITMRHALEHVPQPREVLGAARDLLVGGGRLVITVPHFNSLEREVFGDGAMTLDLPRHLLHFTPETLQGLLGSCGFTEISVRQRSRKNWIRKSLLLAEKRGTRKSGDWPLKMGIFRHFAAARAEREGKGNELIAIAHKPAAG